MNKNLLSVLFQRNYLKQSETPLPPREFSAILNWTLHGERNGFGPTLQQINLPALWILVALRCKLEILQWIRG